MKIISYIIALITIVYKIVIGVIWMIGFLLLFLLFGAGMLFLAIPYLIIGELIETVFGKNYLEDLINWIGTFINKYNPFENVFDFMFNNKFVQYGNKCIEELSNDFEALKTYIQDLASLGWGKIKGLFISQNKQLQVASTKGENKINAKEITKKETSSSKDPYGELNPRGIEKSSLKILSKTKEYDRKEKPKRETSSSSEKSEFDKFKKDEIKEKDLNDISISEEIISIKKTNQLELFNAPKNRKKVSKKNIDWLEVNKKRIAVGEIGELIAIKFERQRLSNLGILNPGKYITHTSKEIGDGLGYDITSIDQNKSKTFIEVKTTSSANLFEILITKNELETMNELKDNYFIYIVNCSSPESAIVKRLSYDLIKRNFNLIPDRFKLKEK